MLSNPLIFEKEAVTKTWYKDGRSKSLTVWRYKIGGTMLGSIENFAYDKLAEYRWPDNTIRAVAPDFDKSIALRHIQEVLADIKTAAFPCLR